MNARCVGAAAVLVFAAVSATAAGQVPGQGAGQVTGQGAQAAHRLEDLGWMAGHWATEGEPRSEEYWSRPAGGMMLGMARTLAGGRTVSFEYLRLESRPDGIYYVAQPQGRAPTDFRLARLDAGGAVFENPAHDFPKRIVYRRREDGGITARVEGDPGSKDPPQEFRFRPSREP